MFVDCGSFSWSDVPEIEDQLSAKMKIYKKILLETVLPITVGALFIVIYFFITDNFFREPELENCDSCFPSNITYLKYMLVIIIPPSIYQITLGYYILKRNKNSFKLNVLNSFTFGIMCTGILITINLFKGTIEWEFFPIIFLVIFIFALIFSALIALWRKIFGYKIAH